MIEIITKDVPLAFSLKKDVPKGIEVSFPPIRESFSPDFTAVVTITISFASGVASKIIASWLYDKLKNSRSNQITINRREIIISEGEITKIIEERIQQRK